MGSQYLIMRNAAAATATTAKTIRPTGDRRTPRAEPMTPIAPPITVKIVPTELITAPRTINTGPNTVKIAEIAPAIRRSPGLDSAKLANFVRNDSTRGIPFSKAGRMASPMLVAMFARMSGFWLKNSASLLMNSVILGITFFNAEVKLAPMFSLSSPKAFLISLI